MKFSIPTIAIALMSILTTTVFNFQHEAGMSPFFEPLHEGIIIKCQTDGDNSIYLSDSQIDVVPIVKVIFEASSPAAYWKQTIDCSGILGEPKCAATGIFKIRAPCDAVCQDKLHNWALEATKRKMSKGLCTFDDDNGNATAGFFWVYHGCGCSREGPHGRGKIAKGTIDVVSPDLSTESSQ